MGGIPLTRAGYYLLLRGCGGERLFAWGVADNRGVMFQTSLQIAAVFLVAVYLRRWRAGLQRRNRQTWESLIARLRQGCNVRELSADFLWREGLSVSPEDVWTRMNGPRGLWAMYKNAGVMMEMAEFAARHSEVDPALLETLRSDAGQIRLCVVQALAQFGIQQAHESVKTRAFRAASMYTGMAARMTQLLQEHAAGALPEFVAAM